MKLGRKGTPNVACFESQTSRASLNSFLRSIDMEKRYLIVGNDDNFNGIFRKLRSKGRDIKIEVLTPEILSDRCRFI
jgi:hypothetical protein